MLGLEDDSFPFKIITRTNEIPTWGKGKPSTKKWLCKSQNSFSGRVKLCFKPPRHRHLYHLCHHHLRGRCGGISWCVWLFFLIKKRDPEISLGFFQIFFSEIFSHLVKIHDFWWIHMCFLHLDSKYGSCFLPSALQIFDHFWLSGVHWNFTGSIASYGEGHRTPWSWYWITESPMTSSKAKRTWRTLWHGLHGRDWESHAPRNLWS